MVGIGCLFTDRDLAYGRFGVVRSHIDHLVGGGSSVGEGHAGGAYECAFRPDVVHMRTPQHAEFDGLAIDLRRYATEIFHGLDEPCTIAYIYGYV